MIVGQSKMVMPDLDVGEVSIVDSVWLKCVGQEVIAGERLLEVAAGEVVVD